MHGLTVMHPSTDDLFRWHNGRRGDTLFSCSLAPLAPRPPVQWSVTLVSLPPHIQHIATIGAYPHCLRLHLLYPLCTLLMGAKRKRIMVKVREVNVVATAVFTPAAYHTAAYHTRRRLRGCQSPPAESAKLVAGRNGSSCIAHASLGVLSRIVPTPSRRPFGTLKSASCVVLLLSRFVGTRVFVGKLHTRISKGAPPLGGTPMDRRTSSRDWKHHPAEGKAL